MVTKEYVIEEWSDKEGMKFRSLIIIRKIAGNVIIANKSQFLNEDTWVDATGFEYNVTVCPISLIQSIFI